MGEKTYTTFDIADILDVYPTTIAKWIDDGELAAFLTPGGHRRVLEKDLLEFLRRHDMPVPEQLGDSSKTRVLLVDDDPGLLRAMARFLGNVKDFTIYKAADGFEAGTAVEVYNPDIVVLDLRLPGIDGFDVCAKIRKRRKDVGIIAVTGFDTPDNRKRIFAAGADSYLAKPFELEALRKEINALTGRE